MSNEDMSLFITQFYCIMEEIGMPVTKEKMLVPTDFARISQVNSEFHFTVLGYPREEEVKMFNLGSENNNRTQGEEEVNGQGHPADCRQSEFYLSGTSR